MTLLNPIIQPPIVQVTPTGDGTTLTISWPAQSDASGYYVYAGFEPISIRSLISGVNPLPASQTSFQFTTPFTPPGQVLYFWVAKIVGGVSYLLSDIGSYTYDTAAPGQFSPSPITYEMDVTIIDYELYYFQEIRSRSKVILEDTGELVDVYIKQWTGLADPTTQSALGLDPNYQGMTRDDNTYGVGFFPGYFPAITLRMRLGALPNNLLDFQIPGMRPMLTNEAWTLWDPLLHENDVIVRRSTGMRYVISSIAPSNFRGVPITQRISLDLVSPTSPLQKITDADVRAKWAQVNATDFMRVGLGVAANSTGGPVFIIF